MENEAQTRNGSGGDPVYEINQKEKKIYKNVEFRLCGGRLFPFFFFSRLNREGFLRYTEKVAET